MIEIRVGDARYPAGLRDLAAPPDPIWVDGDVTALEGPAVAIVGTRRMTGYGERVAHDLARALASRGVVIVSGLAQGIDSAAHRGALDGGGRTVAVLGESIAMLRATVRGRRRPLVSRICASGALLSEFAAPFSARAWSFVRRDATIAALAAAVIVVEAPVGSGALITAADARRLGRALFAVPGPLGSVASVGTNALIARGQARALLDVSDVIGGMPAGAALPADPLLDALRDGPLGVDELARRSRLPLPALSARVAALLLRGELLSMPDGRLRRP